MFERFLYIGNIRSLCKVLRAFGLFPQQGPSMQMYTPDFYLACQYMSFNVQSQSTSDRFCQIIAAMKTLSKFSTHIQRLFKKEEFNPSLYFVSVIPFWTLSMICYIKSSVDNLNEFPMLRGGTYVGSKNVVVGIELQKPVTDNEGIMTQQVHKVTRMRDITLLSCKEQPNMFERELIGFCLFRWRDSETFTSGEAKRWRVCRRGWDEKIEKTIILSIDWLQVADIEDQVQEKLLEKAKKRPKQPVHQRRSRSPKGSRVVVKRMKCLPTTTP